MSITTVLASLLLMAISCHAFAQDSCDCPSINECSPCQDGITSLKLKYTGNQNLNLNISIDDQQVTVYSGGVNPGDTIVINGSASNGKFLGNKLTIRENGVVKATLNVSCGQPIYLKSIIANFIVIGGRSMAGGELCCDPAPVKPIRPVIYNCPSDVEENLPEGACSATINWVEPTVFDNCEVVSFTSSHEPGSAFSSGTTKVVYTATDKLGTSTTCTFNVTLHDVAAPALHCPGNITVAADPTCQAQVTWQLPVATDNCTVNAVVSSHKPGDVFPFGTTVVTYTATDPSGNTASCQFTVTVLDESSPVFSSCPRDISLIAGVTGEAEAYWSPPTARDPCSTVALTSTHEPGGSFPIGRTDVVYTATDRIGNTSICAFKVKVSYGDIDFNFQKVLTPDGDGVNDEWFVLNIKKFSDNNVTIVDRWGGVIFTGTGYDNDKVVWKGQNTSGTIVPTGTYFYAVRINTGTGILEKRGFIELIRSR